MRPRAGAAPHRGPSPGILETTGRPAEWIRLGTGLGATGYALLAAYGVLFRLGPYGEQLRQVTVAAACAAAFLISRSRPRLAGLFAIGSVLGEVLFSIGQNGVGSSGTYALPLFVTGAGLLLGGRAAVATAALAGLVVPAAATLWPAPYAGWAPGLLGARLLALEIVLAAGAAFTWSALKAYAGALDAARREAAERIALEDRLHHGQRLETVGQLAGGVAHDFNNLLTAIGGNAAVLAGHADPDVREIAGEIAEAQERGVTLTRQLLAFARREPRTPEPLDLADAVRGTGRLLERLLGERHRLSLDAAGAVPVMADRSQLEQVALNLVSNARDALPRGGEVRVQVRALSRAEAAGLGSPLPGERQALLEVQDDGEGMPPEVAARVFEPFFTTKARGRGTGLGLATVHGIVAQSGGHVALETAVGHGARFRVFLPLAEAAPGAPAAAAERAPAAGGSEQILLVEDDPHVRRLAERVLAGAGYRVAVADSGAAALAAFPALSDPRLLLTDVAMPGMSGVELAAALRRAAPGLRVLFMSGYWDASLADPSLDAARELVEKPFSPDVLLARVRAALDRDPRRA